MSVHICQKQIINFVSGESCTENSHEINSTHKKSIDLLFNGTELKVYIRYNFFNYTNIGSEFTNDRPLHLSKIMKMNSNIVKENNNFLNKENIN